MKLLNMVPLCGAFLFFGPAFCRAETAAAAAKPDAAGVKAQAQARYVAGLAAYQAGDYEKAGGEWALAAALDPQDPDAKAGLKRLKERTEDNSGPAADPASTGLVKGYRGTAIPVDGDQLLYVNSGDRVDVLVTFEALTAKDKKETMTATILQNIVVLNVRRPEKGGEPGAIELLLNPVEAQYAALSVAQAKNINITVRAPGDVELHPMDMASFRKLIR